MLRKGAVLLLFLLLLVPTVLASPPGGPPVDFNLTPIKGPSYIKWNWSISDTYNWSKTIFLNGLKLYDNQTTLGYYVQDALNYNEESRMDMFIYNTSNTSEFYSKTATARTSDQNWYWWVGLTITFMVLGYFVWIFNLTAIISAILTAQSVGQVTTNEYTLLAVWFLVPFTIFIAGATLRRQ